MNDKKKKKREKKRDLNILINAILRSIVIKENFNISHLMCLTISYIIKKFNFMLKQLYKDVI